MRGVPVWSMEHWGETPRSARDLSRGCLWGRVIRRRGTTYPSEQVVLQIEFASSRAQLLDCLDNLNPASDVLDCRRKYQTRTLIASAITCPVTKVSLSVPRKGGVVSHLWAAVVARKNDNVVFRHDCTSEVGGPTEKIRRSSSEVGGPAEKVRWSSSEEGSVLCDGV